MLSFIDSTLVVVKDWNKCTISGYINYSICIKWQKIKVPKELILKHSHIHWMSKYKICKLLVFVYSSSHTVKVFWMV